MDPQTLPAQVQDLYTKIRKQYKVAFEPLQLGEVRLNLLKVTDLEEMLDGRDPFQDVSEFPFWIKLWEAAIVLAQFLTGQNFTGETRILELGAGLGAPGLAAAACGARVTLTDYEELILDFSRVSAAASKVSDNVTFELLDWLDPPDMEPFDVIIGQRYFSGKSSLNPCSGCCAGRSSPVESFTWPTMPTARVCSPFLNWRKRSIRSRP
ncbi:hypothetical protein GF1_24370 [Desulfolithobacter dissulfuricans]|uniref:Methyltransferase n=1 Tax=Desulfolithobacter dissulfuricans TaxID=2795293 RepID=A0A915XLM3_9BACT|nr:methyltransferase [Desulfolithobacter dissulfuricans]BCO10061.1 hypothetical protein GF1_24370 [Desulfolithobacter dissulfuricans]